ncbi:Baseplate assembly protein J [gamma proteobacterium IMCC1989]|nr:Baseplate assembly protein J [gamma proteobacterium IMCC1989]
MTNMIDLPLLPAPDLVEGLDYENTFSNMRDQLNGLQPLLFTDQYTPVLLEAELFTADNGDKYFKVPASSDTGLLYLDLESDPQTKQLQVFAYREMLLTQKINNAAKATMIAFANGADLDQEAARFGVKRLIITPPEPDAIPPKEAVYESDPSLRYRTQLALEGFSTAGSRGAYEFHALSASAKVKAVDVAAPKFTYVTLTSEQKNMLPEGAIVIIPEDDAGLTDPVPGDVAVTVLSTEANGEASEETLTSVRAALSPEDVRPLNDNPRTRSAEIVEYTVDASLILSSGPDDSVVLEAAEKALNDYVENSRSIGIPPTIAGLYSVLKQPGVYDVVLNEPSSPIELTSYQSAFCTGVNLTLGGING